MFTTTVGQQFARFGGEGHGYSKTRWDNLPDPGHCIRVVYSEKGTEREKKREREREGEGEA